MRDLWNDRKFKPMLLKEVDKPFNSKDYIFELKFDGVRALIFVNKSSIYIQSRNGVDLTHQFPELKSICKKVKKNVIFDGEIVSFKEGKPSFSDVQKRIRIKNERKIEILGEEEPVVFVVFDILYEDKNLTDLELMERKKYLDKYSDSDVFVKTKFIEEKGIELFKSVKKLGLEGIVAKEKYGLYHIDKRTDDFIKIKNIRRDEFFIGGYELKKDDMLSLSLGEYRNNEFHFVGKASIRKTSKIYDKVLKAKKTKNYFSDFNEDIIYIKPIITLQVEYLEKTKGGHLRHPIIVDI